MPTTAQYDLYYPGQTTPFAPSTKDMEQMAQTVEQAMYALEQRVQGGAGGALYKLNLALQEAAYAEDRADSSMAKALSAISTADNALSVANGIDAKAQQALDTAQATIAPTDNQVAALFDDADSATSTAMKAYMQGYATSSAFATLSSTVSSNMGLRAAIDHASPNFVGTMEGLAGAHLQSFEMDSSTGEYYAAVGDVGDTNDTYIYRLSPGLRMVDYAILTAAGHGTSIALSKDTSGNVWIYGWWANDTSGSFKGFRWKYSGSTSGKVIARANADVQTLTDFNSGTAVTYAIDQKNDRIALRRASGSDAIVDVRKLSEFLAGTGSTVGTVTFPGSPDGKAWQGFQIVDDDIYHYAGGSSSGSGPSLYRYSWNPTGDDGTQDFGYLLGEGEGVTLWRSGDGTPTLAIATTQGVSGGWRNSVYSIPALGGDDLRRELNHSDRKQVGRVLITPTKANVPTVLHVDFDWAFDAVPAVFVTPFTGGPGVQVMGCSCNNPSTTGVDIVLTRTNTIPTSVFWVAYEM